ncbi:WecB/TagA/CpsF family glycosyltransferase [soil metagenome]
MLPTSERTGLEPLPSANVLGYEVAVCTLEEAARWCLAAVQQQPAHPAETRLVITLNPEIIVQARSNPALQEALAAAALTVADGVGVVWAARCCGAALPERVPGVELVSRLLEIGGDGLKVFFLGSKPGVAERAAAAARSHYGTRVAGVQHGYFARPDDTPDVLNRVRDSGAQLLLAGLGEGQELFLFEHRHALSVPLLLGVGDTLDVLAGEVQRTPAWTRRAGLEWAYRVGSDRKRWHRFPRLLTFTRLVLRESRGVRPDRQP